MAVEKVETPEEITTASVQDALAAAKATLAYTGHPAQEEEEEVVTLPEEENVPPKEELPATVFQYKSQEEAEKAVYEAKKFMHEKAEEAKRTRERAEDLQRQLDDLLTKKREPEVESPNKTTARIGNLLKEIEKLDAEGEDYQGQIAALWGKALDESVNEGISKVVAEQDAKRRQVSTEEELRQSTIKKAQEEAVKAGLDVGDEKSEDQELFWAFASNSPAEASLDEQIAWTINKVKQVKTSMGERYLKAAEKSKETQKENAVLERVGSGKPVEKPAPEIAIGLSDALRQTQRRI